MIYENGPIMLTICFSFVRLSGCTPKVASLKSALDEQGERALRLTEAMATLKADKASALSAASDALKSALSEAEASSAARTKASVAAAVAKIEAQVKKQEAPSSAAAVAVNDAGAPGATPPSKNAVEATLKKELKREAEAPQADDDDVDDDSSSSHKAAAAMASLEVENKLIAEKVVAIILFICLLACLCLPVAVKTFNSTPHCSLSLSTSTLSLPSD